jgi:hypothetical protein
MNTLFSQAAKAGLLTLSLAAGGVALAQGSTPGTGTSATPAAASIPAARRQLAERVVNLQKGPELQRLLAQLVDEAAAPVVEKWAQRLAEVPEARQAAMRDRLNTELQKFGRDIAGLLESTADRVGRETLAPAYAERFTDAELRALIAMFEAPAYKKYQEVAPQLGGTFVQALIEGVRTQVQDRRGAFDATAAQIVNP